ncbi:hypothetical protein [uncultured Salinicola sp.]|uniref:hypothetical protein n=1 Tax=uncultured Salinicola sp. TaxID=1193542 RepID=UPI00261AF436|nr:hypothetical protein [uncultured Salinicola sp.]
MAGFVDRRLMTRDMALAEVEQMDRQLAGYAEEYGLAGDNLPRVIGASDENAWVETKYLVAWGCELKAWNEREPQNYTIHYQSPCDPQDLGGLREFNLLEGTKVNPSDLRRIALAVGRRREMQSIGVEPRTNPLWSFAASTFAKAVVLDHLDRHGRLDLNSRSIEMNGPVIGLSFRAEWNQNLQYIDEGRMSISGALHVPEAVKLGIEKYEGRPLSSLIEGKSYENITIESIHVPERYDDDDDDGETSITISFRGGIERLGKTPSTIPDGNPLTRWLELARD